MAVTRVKDVVAFLEDWAPPCLACDWDPVGLQVGDMAMRLANMGVTLDADRRAVTAANRHGIQLIISHHPLIFKPFSSIHYDDPRQAVLADIVRQRRSLYTGHTAFDACAEGTNTQLAKHLGIDPKHCQPLVTTYREPLCKLVTFVPHSHVDRVRQAMGDAGAGHIGNYSHCSFSSAGLGSFTPLQGAHPFIGRTGNLEKVEETRIELVVPKLQLAPVLAAMRRAHPYEEVAFDVYPMDVVIKTWGVGFVADAARAGFGKTALQTLFPYARWKGAKAGAKKFKRLAVLGGSGGSQVMAALRANADVYITGDLTHHHEILARDGGLPLLDMGHTFGEILMLKALRKYLAKTFRNLNVFSL